MIKAMVGRLILTVTSGGEISRDDSELLARQLLHAQAEAAAYKWAYAYLQDRMRSVGREGWAEDCDSEIAARIADAAS